MLGQRLQLLRMGMFSPHLRQPESDHVCKRVVVSYGNGNSQLNSIQPKDAQKIYLGGINQLIFGTRSIEFSIFITAFTPWKKLIVRMQVHKPSVVSHESSMGLICIHFYGPPWATFVHYDMLSRGIGMLTHVTVVGKQQDSLHEHDVRWLVITHQLEDVSI